MAPGNHSPRMNECLSFPKVGEPGPGITEIMQDFYGVEKGDMCPVHDAGANHVAL